MKPMILAVLSLAALAFACPAGFCTANESTTELLIKGAGVDPADVHWRIQAGLSPAQAVEVALQQKREQESHAASPKTLQDLTVAQLKELAAEKSIEVSPDMKKADIIAAIQAGNEGGTK